MELFEGVFYIGWTCHSAD